MWCEKTRRVAANAKINLFLSVGGKKENGYHEIDTVLQEIDFCDFLTLRPTNGAGVTLRVLGCDSIEQDENNLVVRAANALFAHLGCQYSVEITLEKRIFVGAGLGGGSADAAATLKALNEMLGSPLTVGQLCALAEPMGADIPFCIVGGCQRGEDIGQRLTPVPPLPKSCTVVCAMGQTCVSTAAAYRALDGHGVRTLRSAASMCKALSAGKLSDIVAEMENDFQAVTEGVLPLVALMHSTGALGAQMSGSGAAVFGLYDDPALAEQAVKRLHLDGYRATVAHPVA